MENMNLREYETLYVINPHLDDQSAQKIMRDMKGLVEKEKGISIKVDCLGKRQMAWPCQKNNRGIFVNHRYAMDPQAIAKYEYAISINEHILLRQTTLLNKEPTEQNLLQQEDQLQIPIIREQREPREQHNNFDE